VGKEEKEVKEKNFQIIVGGVFADRKPWCKGRKGKRGFGPFTELD